jgi:DNA-binding transcriptional MerR regulator
VTAGRSEPLQRIEELAEASGTTVRNIRVYQERGLMPAPIRQGRSALYGPEHRERLTTILRLLDRGYTFATIEELLAVDRVRPERRHAGARRRLSRAEAEAIAGFDLSEDMIAMGESIGLKSEPSSSDYFFSDAYMGELFQELILLGMGDEGIERIGTLFMGVRAPPPRRWGCWWTPSG